MLHFFGLKLMKEVSTGGYAQFFTERFVFRLNNLDPRVFAERFVNASKLFLIYFTPKYDCVMIWNLGLPDSTAVLIRLQLQWTVNGYLREDPEELCAHGKLQQAR